MVILQQTERVSDNKIGYNNLPPFESTDFNDCMDCPSEACVIIHGSLQSAFLYIGPQFTGHVEVSSMDMTGARYEETNIRTINV